MQFKLYSLKDKDFWIYDFNKKIDQILKSNDPKKDNYNNKNFNLNDLNEISIIYMENELICFSSVWTKKYYPYNTFRILNRAWKDPSIRWRKPAYYVLSDLMVKHQIEACKKINADYAFISTEGNRKLWLKKWVMEANKQGFNFKQIDGMAKVCDGEKSKCYQNVAYLPIKNQKEPPTFIEMSYKDWKEYNVFSKK